MKKSMSKLIWIAVTSVTVFSSCAVTSNTGKLTTTQFTVYGNCGMCENTIEGSLKGVDGIDNADWVRETKMMSVTYDSTKMSEDDIKTKIAAVGYDTDTKRASDRAYSALPGCCKYERPN